MLFVWEACYDTFHNELCPLQHNFEMWDFVCYYNKLSKILVNSAIASIEYTIENPIQFDRFI